MKATWNILCLALAAMILGSCDAHYRQSTLQVDCTASLYALAAFYSYNTVDWCAMDELYRPYNADWSEAIEAKILPEFPCEMLAPYWNRLQNAKTEFHRQTLPLRAVAPQEAIAQLDRTEAMFDSLFVYTVSQEYYMRIYVDCYEELIPAEIDHCFICLNPLLK